MPVVRQSMPMQYNSFHENTEMAYPQEEVMGDYYNINRVPMDYSMDQDMYDNSTLNQSMDLMKMAANMNMRKNYYYQQPLPPPPMYEEWDNPEMYQMDDGYYQSDVDMMYQQPPQMMYNQYNQSRYQIPMTQHNISMPIKPPVKTNLVMKPGAQLQTSPKVQHTLVESEFKNENLNKLSLTN